MNLMLLKMINKLWKLHEARVLLQDIQNAKSLKNKLQKRQLQAKQRLENPRTEENNDTLLLLDTTKFQLYNGLFQLKKN